MMGKEELRIRKKILFMFMIVIMGLIGIVLIANYYTQKKLLISEHAKKINSVKKLLNTKITDDSELLISLIKIIQKNRLIQQAWLDKNQQQLFDYSQPIFEELHSKYQITHFYFYNIDKICFLRVHNPDRFGDTITRHTLAKSIEQQQEFHGIELGPYGTLTLRVVYPWRIDGKVAGYIELGEEIEYLSTKLRDVLKDEIVTTIPKSLLNRTKWEEGLQMLDRKGDWDQFPNFVVTDQTLDKVPSEIMANILKKSHDGKECLKITEVRSSSRQVYLYSCFMLEDAAGKNIARYIVFRDITRDVTSFRSQIRFYLLLTLIIVSLLFGIFYRFLGQIERRLQRAYAAQESEIQRRKAIEEQLIEAKDKAEDASRVKSEFLDNMSHEIRTPMNSIIGFTELLQDEALTEEQVDYINLISDNSKHLLNLVNDVLDISNIDSGTLKLNIMPCQLRELMDKIDSTMRPIAENKKLQFKVDSEELLSQEVMIDVDRLCQCLINLIDNAIKFTKTGRVHVNFSNIQDNGKTSLCITVQDTGIGIPADKQGTVFKAFMQADNSSTRHYGGTGLGLTITKRLVKLMGGQLTLQSEEGYGTLFTIFLPLESSPVKLTI